MQVLRAGDDSDGGPRARGLRRAQHHGHRQGRQGPHLLHRQRPVDYCECLLYKYWCSADCIIYSYFTIFRMLRSVGADIFFTNKIDIINC